MAQACEELKIAVKTIRSGTVSLCQCDVDTRLGCWP